MKPSHIEVRVGTEGVDVIADDCEVFDFIDDFLTERGLEFEFTCEEERDGRRFYVMHFASDVTRDRVVEALDGIPEGEVERIWKLNN